MSERVDWEALPEELRTAVERRTGRVTSAVVVPEGLNCSLALTLSTTAHGMLFLKGVRESDHAELAALRWEESVNRTVRGIGPSIRHTFAAAGWRCLAFVHIEGRHADLGPGSRDLNAVARTLRRIPALRVPDLPLPRFADRYAEFLHPHEAAALHGRHLLHTDTNPHNIMIGRGGVAYIIDWAMPATGPSWIDPAYTAVRLMECERSPEEAMAWLSGFPHWCTADRTAVETFVDAECRRWTATVGEKGAAASNARFRVLLDAAPAARPRPVARSAGGASVRRLFR
ncbi:phosphotransferase [Streptomyces sp. CAU 1734]|uniref:phosphotransferase family protein n=1 Tax=Streptomyces sp. CAU 1734 TaxID=3140360 RepID=UPI0032614A9C